MLAEAVNYLDKTYLGESEWEILIVDDGSSDNTTDVALEWATELQEAGAFDDGQVRICRLKKNRGKGGAVSHVHPLTFGLTIGDATCSWTIHYIRGRGWSEQVWRFERTGEGVESY